MFLARLLQSRRAVSETAWERLWRGYWNVQWFLQHVSQMYAQRAVLPKPHHSERAVLIEELARFTPIESLLEVGCGYGQNFFFLQKWFPATTMTGIDPDRAAVEEGNRALHSAGIVNATLLHGDGSYLEPLPDKSIDVVYSSASLLFVGPQLFAATVSQMGRVAKKAVVFLELHDPEAGVGVLSEERMNRGPYWIRDFADAVPRLLPGMKIRLRPILNPLWETESWYAHGCVMTAWHETK
ncbi:MAG: methyltransferase domain-containing protein [Bdellovibrionales bacterium]|nr:methyltransferase domain-containing protein [Bdellovibrionales bacterium]